MKNCSSSHTGATRRRAAVALTAFVAMVCVALLAPFVQQAGYELVCSAGGPKVVVLDQHGAGGPAAGDHAAHCPLCMPVGAPPTEIVFAVAGAQPVAHVLRSIPTARLVSLVGAPLPARGPPAAA